MWDRVALYGLGTAAAGTLLWFAYFNEPKPDIGSSVLEVMNLTAEGAFSEAEDLIARVRNAWPDDVRGLHLQAWYEERRGDLAAAQDSYRQSLSLCPDDATKRHVMLCIADLDRRLGNEDRAKRYLEQAVKQYGESFRSRKLRSVLSGAKDSHIQEVKGPTKVVERESGNASGSR